MLLAAKWAIINPSYAIFRCFPMFSGLKNVHLHVPGVGIREGSYVVCHNVHFTGLFSCTTMSSSQEQLPAQGSGETLSPQVQETPEDPARAALQPDGDQVPPEDPSQQDLEDDPHMPVPFAEREKELRSARWSGTATINHQWYQAVGMELKTEQDGGLGHPQRIWADEASRRRPYVQPLLEPAGATPGGATQSHRLAQHREWQVLLAVGSAPDESTGACTAVKIRRRPLHCQMDDHCAGGRAEVRMPKEDQGGRQRRLQRQYQSDQGDEGVRVPVPLPPVGPGLRRCKTPEGRGHAYPHAECHRSCRTERGHREAGM